MQACLGNKHPPRGQPPEDDNPLIQPFWGYHRLAVKRRPDSHELWPGIITEAMLQDLDGIATVAAGFPSAVCPASKTLRAICTRGQGPFHCQGKIHALLHSRASWGIRADLVLGSQKDKEPKPDTHDIQA